MMAENKLYYPKEVTFQEDDGFLLVKIDMESYGYNQQAVILDGRRLEPKDELHITVLSRDAAEQVARHMEQKPQGRQEMKNLVEQTEWSFHKQERFYHVSEDAETETIIQMVKMPGLEDFFRNLGELIGERLEIPPVHVTLFMRGTEKGIGLPTRQVFDELVQGRVELDELERAA
jgi:hypothetical protein